MSNYLQESYDESLKENAHLVEKLKLAVEALEKAERNFRSMLCDGLADDVEDALKAIHREE